MAECPKCGKRRRWQEDPGDSQRMLVFCPCTPDVPVLSADRAVVIGLEAIPGIGRETARMLFHAGIRTLDDACAASVDELLAIEGIGPKTAGKLVAYCIQRGVSGEHGS